MRLPLPQLASQSRQPGHIAEVIETSTTEFLAQCLEPDSLSFAQMPPFGSWVKATDEDSGNQIYGVVPCHDEPIGLGASGDCSGAVFGRTARTAAADFCDVKDGISRGDRGFLSSR